jgi:ABC-type transport system involved in cytochrome bd biosynthesis fused ATPase/permease subunit
MKSLIFVSITILLFLYLKSKATLGLFAYFIICLMLALSYMAGTSGDYQSLKKLKNELDSKINEYLQIMKASFKETQTRLQENHGHSS